MKVITLSGRQGCGKTRRAQVLYTYYAAQNKSVALFDDDGSCGSFTDLRAKTQPDVKIVTRESSTDLQETEKEQASG